jgi:hypothetical protein
VSEGLPQTEEWRQEFAFADMNGDGLPDIVTSPPRKSKEARPYIFLHHQDRWEQACKGTSSGGFPEQQSYFYGGVAVADFDKDGFPEIAIAMHQTGIRIFQSQKKDPCGPWSEVQNLPRAMTRMRTRSIVAGDMDRDGRIDLIALSEVPGVDVDFRTSGIEIFWNRVSGWMPKSLPGSESLIGDDLALGEVNGDGAPDLAVGSLTAEHPQFAWLSDGHGGWKPRAEGLPRSILAWSVQLVDLDHDGKDELLLGTGSGSLSKRDSGPRVYKWDGARWSDLSKGLPEVSHISGVTAADLDGDGNKEIIAAGMHSGLVHVYARQADGTWIERQRFEVPNSKGLRNYRVHALLRSRDSESRGSLLPPLIIANYAGEVGTGRILAWVPRQKDRL